MGGAYLNCVRDEPTTFNYHPILLGFEPWTLWMHQRLSLKLTW